MAYLIKDLLSEAKATWTDEMLHSRFKTNKRVGVH